MDLWIVETVANLFQALLYSQSTAEDSTIDLHSIASSTSGAIFLGTTELDSRLEGLQSYLASAQGSGQESSEVYQEALWLIHTLQKFPLIGENIWTLSVHERPGSSHAEVKWDEVRICQSFFFLFLTVAHAQNRVAVPIYSSRLAMMK